MGHVVVVLNWGLPRFHVNGTYIQSITFGMTLYLHRFCKDPDNADFWEALGGKITVTQKGAADDEVESGKQWTPVLIKISDANGSLESVKINLPECKVDIKSRRILTRAHLCLLSLVPLYGV